MRMFTITKTYLYNFDPLKPHFYVVKLGLTEVCIIFLISSHKHRLWVLVRTASMRRFWRVPTIYVLSRNMKNIRIYFLKICHFLVVEFSVYLNRRVFVMNIWKLYTCISRTMRKRYSVHMRTAKTELISQLKNLWILLNKNNIQKSPWQDCITKTRLFKYTEYFITKKMKIFR